MTVMVLMYNRPICNDETCTPVVQIDSDYLDLCEGRFIVTRHEKCVTRFLFDY